MPFPQGSSQRPAGKNMERNNEKSEDASSQEAYCSCCRCFWEFFSRLPIGDAQNSSNSAEIENLKLIVDQQQKALEQQQAQIQALQSALTEQKKML